MNSTHFGPWDSDNTINNYAKLQVNPQPTITRQMSILMVKRNNKKEQRIMKSPVIIKAQSAQLSKQIGPKSVELRSTTLKLRELKKKQDEKYITIDSLNNTKRERILVNLGSYSYRKDEKKAENIEKADNEKQIFYQRRRILKYMRPDDLDSGSIFFSKKDNIYIKNKQNFSLPKISLNLGQKMTSNFNENDKTNRQQLIFLKNKFEQS